MTWQRNTASATAARLAKAAARTVLDRLLPKVQIDDRGCWIWQAALDDGGYGKFYDGSMMRTAHVVAYEQIVGPVPKGLELDHVCRVRRCVNPEHMEPVTSAENSRRAMALIVRCPAGHPYDEDNTYMHRGARHCKECRRARNRADYARRRALITGERPGAAADDQAVA